jgi:hypothetical protein
MNEDLNPDHGLFKQLEKNPPDWWVNLKSDRDLYIDIRKGNSINVYYNGGSLMRLKWDNGYKAEIHHEYIPLERKKAYVSFEFKDNEISLEEMTAIDINNFHSNTLSQIKKRIERFNKNDSEKGLQGTYVVRNNTKESANGFFIDTEFASDRIRIDMVWVNLEKKEIAFVELKTIDDARLYPYKGQNKDTEAIDDQLRKYHGFVRQNAKLLIQYYDRVYQIKKKLDLLPSYTTEVKGISDYTFIEKPILLVGNCTRDWIKKHDEKLDEAIQEIAFGRIYQGTNTFDFNIPESTRTIYNYRFIKD